MPMFLPRAGCSPSKRNLSHEAKPCFLAVRKIEAAPTVAFSFSHFCLDEKGISRTLLDEKQAKGKAL